jgi:nitrogen fixation protein NifU and related proteins
MDRQEQIDAILDHYENPRHRGELPHPDLTAEGRNPGCGDVVRLFVKLGEGERISAITFEGQGCTISQAAASMVTEMALGKTLAEAAALDAAAFAVQLGPEVVASRPNCVTLALDVLKEAEAAYRVRGNGHAAHTPQSRFDE